MENVETKNEVYTYVYNHLVNLYQRFRLAVKPYLDMTDQALISYDAYREMIQMAQDGYIYDYYKRVKKGTV